MPQRLWRLSHHEYRQSVVALLGPTIANQNASDFPKLATDATKDGFSNQSGLLLSSETLVEQYDQAGLYFAGKRVQAPN